MTIATILCKKNKYLVLYQWVGDSAEFETIEQAQKFCSDNGFAVVIRAAQQSVQADLADESENEVDPITQALRNLGSAIAPPSR